jgi:hypothetical protein
MTPRPIHRWKSFWLGVLVLIFLGWAWVTSMSLLHIAGYIYPSKSQAIFLRNLPGTIEIENTGPHYSVTPVTPPVQWYSYARIHDPVWLPRPMLFQPFGALGGWTVHLPYWLITPLFLIPWTGLLAWRWRQIKRFAAEARSST